ncbi:hypothetical protein [uncultured Cohaesibacter sp.]|uniref:hypothetical protein n=1 Tax=uncultured Cohaesibacter sp. TaxID=1002546 RepID=UPI0029C9A38B|nr:hypothetical protein [uncultured Cohaesibacter sp.]
MFLQTTPAPIIARKRIYTLTGMISFVSATILIDTLILSTAAILVWAIGSILMLSIAPFLTFATIILVPAFILAVKVGMMVFDVETTPES